MPWPSDWPLYILAGGYSSRFGSDKARAKWQGQVLLQHVAQALPMAAPVWVVADQADKYTDLGFTTLADPEPHLGPLGGLLTALNHTEGYCGVVSCDLLGLQPHWFELLANRAVTSPAVVFRHSRWEPFPGLYHADLAPSLALYLQHGHRTFWRWLESVETFALAVPGDWEQLVVVNRPEDLPPG